MAVTSSLPGNKAKVLDIRKYPRDYCGEWMKMTQALISTVPVSSTKSDCCSSRLFTTLFSFSDSAVKHASVLAPTGSSLLSEEVFLLHSSESVHTLIPYSSRYDFMIHYLHKQLHFFQCLKQLTMWLIRRGTYTNAWVLPTELFLCILSILVLTRRFCL